MPRYRPHRQNPRRRGDQSSPDDTRPALYSGAMSRAHESDLECLERFVAENDELLELEERIGRFNVFDALGIARAEIRHSNFLAWLLNPNESHGQGDLFLKAVLMDILRRARRNDISVPISAVSLDGAEFRDVEIHREWKGIDLLIRCSDPALVVTIENKVDSGEHSGQLGRYEAVAEADFEGIPSLFVFLTPDGRHASDIDWTPYSYADIFRVLSRVRRQAGGSLGPDVAIFLDHYLNLIGSRFMEDPHVHDLCRKIYANHRRAIDLLIEHAGSPKHEILKPVRDWLSTKHEYILRSSPRNLLYLVPRSWVGSISEANGEPSSRSPCDIFIEVESWGGEDSNASIRVVVGIGANSERRLEVINRLMAASPILKMQRKTPSASWTRLGSKTLLKWKKDEQIKAELIVPGVEQYLSSIHTVMESVPSILKDLL